MLREGSVDVLFCRRHAVAGDNISDNNIAISLVGRADFIELRSLHEVGGLDLAALGGRTRDKN